MRLLTRSPNTRTPVRAPMAAAWCRPSALKPRAPTSSTTSSPLARIFAISVTRSGGTDRGASASSFPAGGPPGSQAASDGSTRVATWPGGFNEA